jgi:NAD+ kinase
MTEDSGSERRVLVVAHTGRPAARDAAIEVTDRLRAAGIAVDALASERADLADRADIGSVAEPIDQASSPGRWELVLVLGGDGTLLRGAELARPSGAPLLGVNLGHVGFLAEAEPEQIEATVDAVVRRKYTIEERMTLDVTVHDDGGNPIAEWALNEATVEKRARERMLELVVEIDGHPLSRWGCDGAVCSTPTGSTAYAFSAGGPVVWPEVEAMLLVPISAHALFARPLVVSPSSTVAIELLPGTAPGVLWCDGRRMHDIDPGARIEVRRGASRVRLARMHALPFTDRLVAKFDLPVHGWRGRPGAPGRR